MGDLRKIEYRFKIVKVFLCSLALLILSASISTNFWPKTKGTIIYNQSTFHMNGMSMPANGYSGRFGGTFRWQSAGYRFKANGKSLESDLLCICIAIGLSVPHVGGAVTVSYLPFVPSISVVSTGPHFILVGIILIFGALAYVFERIVRSERNVRA